MSQNMSNSLSPVFQETKTEIINTKMVTNPVSPSTLSSQSTSSPCGNRLPMGQMIKEAILWLLVIFSFAWIIAFCSGWSYLKVVEVGETVALTTADMCKVKCAIIAAIVAILAVLAIWIFRSCSKY
jgi:hypothetical protein